MTKDIIGASLASFEQALPAAPPENPTVKALRKRFVQATRQAKAPANGT